MEKWPRFKKMIGNKMFSDCRIMVEKESFDCHKVILSDASEFFERMFLSDFQESKSGEFRLNDISPNIFSIFLEYVYTWDNLEKNETSIIMKLWEYGNMLLVKSIKEDCAGILRNRLYCMGSHDRFELFKLAHNANDQELIEIAQLNWQCKPYSGALTLPPNLFEKYLAFAKYVVLDIDRFNLIDRYVRINGLNNIETAKDETDIDDKNKDTDTETDSAVGVVSKEINNSSNFENDKRINVKKLLGYIDFSKISSDDCYNVVGNSDLLTLNEKYHILYKSERR